MIVGRGKDGNLIRVNNQATLDLLDEYSIPHEYKELNGAHAFVFSRRFLASAFTIALPVKAQPASIGLRSLVMLH